MLNFRALIIGCTIVLSQSYAAFATDYKHLATKNATALYERWITNGKEQVRELKAILQVNAGIQQIVSLLKSQQHGLKWQTKASEFKIVESSTSYQWYNYIKYDLPALMDDQECLLHYSMPFIAIDQVNSYEVSFKSTTHESYPIKSSIKRISGIKGKWILEKKSNNQTQITYIIASDRDKSIPRFVSDPIIKDNLFVMMQNFKALAEKV